MSQPQRKTVRLQRYDYSQPGYYSITICADYKQCIFGVVTNGVLKLNEWGQIVNNAILDLPNHYESVAVDTHMVMPNHVHMILVLREHEDRISGDTASCVTTGNPPIPSHQFGKMIPGSLPAIIRSFKSGVSKSIRDFVKRDIKVWQPGFHDHIIREESNLVRDREYILSNPQRWQNTKQYTPE